MNRLDRPTALAASDASPWHQRNGTLSDKTARMEFGLTQAQIVGAIRSGRLQYRMGSIFGNPFLRLLRSEVESLVRKTHGTRYLKEREARAHLARVERDLRRLRSEIQALEERRGTLLAELAHAVKRLPSRRLRLCNAQRPRG